MNCLNDEVEDWALHKSSLDLEVPKAATHHIIFKETTNRSCNAMSQRVKMPNSFICSSCLVQLWHCRYFFVNQKKVIPLK